MMTTQKSPVLEATLFEQSRSGARGLNLPEAQVPVQRLNTILSSEWIREKSARLPELSQLETVRHFLRLSQLNHCIDKEFYPLGSCTMKYNPKIADRVGAFEAFSGLHPHTPEELSQGALEVIY